MRRDGLQVKGGEGVEGLQIVRCGADSTKDVPLQLEGGLSHLLDPNPLLRGYPVALHKIDEPLLQGHHRIVPHPLVCVVDDVDLPEGVERVSVPEPHVGPDHLCDPWVSQVLEKPPARAVMHLLRFQAPSLGDVVEE